MKNKSIFIVAITLIVLTCIGTDSLAGSSTDIKAHNLDVIISPGTKSLRVIDEVTLTSPAYMKFTFTLNKNIEIYRISSGDIAVPFETAPYNGGEMGESSIMDNFQTVTAHLPKGATGFTIRYGGEIYDPIEPSKALGRVRGDFTSGIISDDGVYLSSSSGWYPDTEGAIATFHIKVSIPRDWYAVTQGDLLDRHVEGARRISEWGCDIPFDGCALVASEYQITTRNIAGIDCSTYFYRDDPRLSAQFLDKLEEYIPAYVDLFGDLPYSRFDIVENFFSTGYGMPAYTLLGSMVLRMPFATREGSLAHELVHNWWGNYVFPDWDTGNWCEGITYYSTNYYWNVLSGTAEEAKDYRYTDMLKFTLQVPEEEEYPVREFRSKWTAVDGNIGYGKASAIFSMMHQMLGDEKFFGALRRLIETHGGKKATWDDFRKVFEDAAGRELDDIFKSWLDKDETLMLKLGNVTQEEVDGNYKVTIEVVQEGEVIHCPISIVVQTAKGEMKMSFEMTEKTHEVSFLSPGKALSVELDPDYYLFRRLHREEIIPCLSATMVSDSILVILPGSGDDAMLQVPERPGPMAPMKDKSVQQLYEELAESIVEDDASVVVKYDYEVTDTDLERASIFCFGAPEYNSQTAKLIGDGDYNVSFSGEGFSVDGTEYDQESNAALVNIRNPYNDDYDVTFYFGNSPQAVFKASYMFFYTMYSFVTYEDGNAVDRGKWELTKGPLYRELN